MNNYNKLFFKGSGKGTTPQQADVVMTGQLPPGDEKMNPDQTLSAEDILSNAELITKVEAELRLCEERNKAPRELLQECVNELEEKGFLNCLEQHADKYLY